MQRRKLLSAIGVGALSLPGISTAHPGGGDETSTSGESGDKNGKNDGKSGGKRNNNGQKAQRTVTLVDTSGLDHESVTADLWLSDKKVTKKESAKLEMELQNTGTDASEIEFTAVSSANGFRGKRERGNVPALFLGSFNRWEPKDGRWQPNSNEYDTSKDDVSMTETLESGRDYRNQFELWSLGENQYLPPGTYEFSRSVTIAGESHDISFIVKIEN